MPRYKITEHLTGWKIVENFIDAKDEDDAWEKHNERDYVNQEWREAEEEYRITDLEITKEGDTPMEGVKKWREQKVIKGNAYEINPDGSEVK